MLMSHNCKTFLTHVTHMRICIISAKPMFVMVNSLRTIVLSYATFTRYSGLPFEMGIPIQPNVLMILSGDPTLQLPTQPFW